MQQTPLRDATWLAVELPDGFNPNVLAPHGSLLLVGGRTPSQRVQPRLATVAPDTATSEIPLTPHSGYAFEATWRSIATDGPRIIAVGGAEGGAHGNVRWTAWHGSVSGLEEVPQPSGTFGGVGAGDLVGAAATTAGPAIAGTWEGDRAGLDAAVWLPDATRWRRQSSGRTTLESTSELLVGPRAVTSSGPGIVLAGSVIELVTGDVRQRAAAWRSERLDQGWRRIDLPDAGARSEAAAVSCTAARCVFAGYVDGSLAIWSAGAAPERLAGVPEVPADIGTTIPAPALIDDAIVQVVSLRGGAAVLVGQGGGWAVYQGPAGTAVSAAAADRWLYVVTEGPGGRRLWRTAITELQSAPGNRAEVHGEGEPAAGIGGRNAAGRPIAEDAAPSLTRT
ncbi:MAG: hypothetical protein ABIS44_02410 [Mycobacteriales bacterium]